MLWVHDLKVWTLNSKGLIGPFSLGENWRNYVGRKAKEMGFGLSHGYGLTLDK